MKFPITFISQNVNFDFIGKKWLGFAISFMIVAGTIISVSTKGLNLGIDFTGGIVMEVRTSEKADLANFRKVFSDNGYSGVSLQNFGTENDVMIRFQAKEVADQAKVIESVKTLLDKNFTKIEYRKIDYVGPQVGRELVKKGIIALVVALGGMMVYLWFRFNWQYGIGGIAALIHDTIATIGFYSITQLEFDLTSIAAILTIIGYSINDSVVIYDRVRENLIKYKKKLLSEILNLSVNQTLSRTVLTAGTTILACLALLIFGGEVIKSFSAAMLFGIVIGTYSSIYISAPILIYTGVRSETGENIIKK